MARYQARRRTVNAIRYMGLCAPIIDWATEDEVELLTFRASDDITNRAVTVKSQYGDHTAMYGDWLVRSDFGRIVVHSDAVFMSEYEPFEPVQCPDID